MSGGWYDPPVPSSARRAAPDLFEALRLEPLHSPAGVPEPVADDVSEASTAEVVKAPPADAAAPVLPEDEFSGLADLLEPGGPPVPPDVAAAADETPPMEDVASATAAAPPRAAPWPWIVLSLILGGTLLWVLWTQTDLFRGDLVARRKAEAAAEARRAQEAAVAEAKARAKRYGQIKIDATPKGARVFWLADGPKATFPALPADGTYVVVALAPGHVPEARRLSGAELTVPVVFDLEPAEGPAPEIPDPGPPSGGSDDRTVDLEVRIATPGGRVGLLIGYTPGAAMTDVDASATHRFLVAAPGHEPREIEVTPDRFQDLGGQRVFTTHVRLDPAQPAGGTTGGRTGSVAGEAGPDAGVAKAGGDGTSAGTEPAAEPRPAKKRHRRKRRRRKRRRKKRR